MSNSEAEIRDLGWAAERNAVPLEVQSRRDLLARFPDSHFRSVERLRFHVVLIGETGSGHHEIDFVATEIRPGRVLHIEPGQVHRWLPGQQFDATMVLFQAVPTGLSRTWALGTSPIDLEPEQLAEVRSVLDLLPAELGQGRSAAARDVSLRALRDLLFVRLGLDQNRTVEQSLPESYVAFRADLEADLTVETTMTARAERIGYSARTISRACLAVSGRTAKQLVDDRLVLEAKRLLAAPGATSAQVASALGFSEATNFAKYFRRLTATTPTGWMATVHPAGPDEAGPEPSGPAI